MQTYLPLINIHFPHSSSNHFGLQKSWVFPVVPIFKSTDCWFFTWTLLMHDSNWQHNVLVALTSSEFAVRILYRHKLKAKDDKPADLIMGIGAWAVMEFYSKCNSWGAKSAQLCNLWKKCWWEEEIFVENNTKKISTIYQFFRKCCKHLQKWKKKKVHHFKKFRKERKFSGREWGKNPGLRETFGRMAFFPPLIHLLNSCDSWSHRWCISIWPFFVQTPSES